MGFVKINVACYSTGKFTFVDILVGIGRLIFENY